MNNLNSFQNTEIWSEDLNKALNNHIKIEYKNFATYQDISNIFDNVGIGCPGMSKEFEKKSDEELNHARNFTKYLNKRGGTVEKLATTSNHVDVIRKHETPIIKAYEVALDLEKSTYVSLLELHGKAENDPALQDLIEEYLDEQIKDQKALNDIIKILQLGGQTALYLFEQELRNRNKL